MNNPVFILLMVMLSMIILSSSLSRFGAKHKINIGKCGRSEKKAAVLFLNEEGWFNVTKWDGIDIEKDLYKNGRMNNDETELKVPPGNNSIVFDAHFTSGRYVYTLKNIELQYYLLPGRKYTIKTSSRSQYDSKRRDLLIQIYAVTNKRELLKEWKMAEAG